MLVENAPLEGIKIIRLKRHGDARGFFLERYNAAAFAEAGLPTNFVQDNHSRSAPGILRGLHYQHGPAQGKLVGAVRGALYDVVVDIRTDSPTFGKHFGIELSDENATLLWVPPGFAHGICMLGSEPVDAMYKVTAPYNPAGEGGIRFDDAELGITWPVEKPIVSARDEALQSFAEYKNNPIQWSAT